MNDNQQIDHAELDPKAGKHTYTFPNGHTVTIRPVNRYETTLMRVALDKQYPPPAPPTQEVPDLGAVANPDDPAHEKALREWEILQSARLSQLVLKYAVDLGIDNQTIAARLAAFDEEANRVRAYLQEQGMDASDGTAFDGALFTEIPDPTGKLRYLNLIAAGGDINEISILSGFVIDLLDSQEATIKAAMRTF